MPNHKVIKAVFVHVLPDAFPPLPVALNKIEGLQIAEIKLNSEDICRRISGLEADAVLLYTAVCRPKITNAIYQIIAGAAYVPVILITNTPVPTDFNLPLTRVANYVIKDTGIFNTNPQIIGDILARLKGLLEYKTQGKIDNSPLNKHIIAWGASTGGTETLNKIFAQLPPKMPGMVVAQHMPEFFIKMFADRLNDTLPFAVMEAEDNKLILPGSIHIAPGKRQLRVEKRGNGFYIRLGSSEKISGHCPSVDALFTSVANAAGSRGIGIILTGMGSDGAKGLLDIRNKGGYTIGQDEATSIIYGMPCKAHEMGGVMVQAPLEKIAGVLLKFLASGK